MKRKMSVKVKWAIGLLIVMIANTFIRILNDYGKPIAIAFLPECFPVIAAIILTFYDHSYTAPKSGNFSILRVWTLVLIWVQPFLSIFTYALAGLFNSVIGYWIGSCIFPAIAFTLLYLDGKNTLNNPQDKSEKPWYYNIVVKELEKQGICNFDETLIKSIWEKANVGGYTDEKLNEAVQTYKALYTPQTLISPAVTSQKDNNDKSNLQTDSKKRLYETITGESKISSDNQESSKQQTPIKPLKPWYHDIVVAELLNQRVFNFTDKIIITLGKKSFRYGNLDQKLLEKNVRDYKETHPFFD